MRPSRLKMAGARRWVPKQERSRSLALVYSGMYTGSILGLALSPHMIARCRAASRVCRRGRRMSLRGPLRLLRLSSASPPEPLFQSLPCLRLGRQTAEPRLLSSSLSTWG